VIITAHQPAYLPWLGYFEKIMRSDIYVFLDTVQFEKNSFTNRNKIKTPQGAIWLTVPVITKGHIGSTILDLKIDKRSNWQRKHLNAITLNYKKASYYRDIIEKISPFYSVEYDGLVDLCYDYTQFWLKTLNIKTKLVRSSELDISSTKSDLIFDLCRHFNADTYISGVLGRDYLDFEKFKKEGIKIEYQDYKPQQYPQLWGTIFLPYMSILDFVMNCNTYEIIKGGVE
jgi:hypothetical protein